MKRLIIGNIPSDFNLTDDEVFAPFCFLNSQKEYPNFGGIVFKTNLNLSPVEKLNIDKETSSFTLNLINDLGEKYNSVNNLKLSSKFWKKVLYTWLISLVQHSYERELQVKSLIKNVNYPFKVELLREEVNWKINSISDFFNLIYSIEYNQWIISRFIENLAPDNWEINYIKLDYIKKTEISNDSFIKNSLKKTLSLLFKRTNKIYGINILNQLYFEFLLRFKRAVIVNKNSGNYRVKKSTNIQFSYSIHKLIEQTQPLFLNKISELVEKYNRRFIPGKIILGGSQYLRGNDDFKIKIGLAVENGEFFIGTQHGGDDYGLSLHCEEIYENEFNNFSFITWGWDKFINYNSNFQRLPSPFLLNFKDKHRFLSNDIILVGTRCNLSNRFLSARPSENQWIEYRNNKLNLLNELNKTELSSRVFYRHFSNTYGSLNDFEFFEKEIPNLNFIHENFHDKIMKCSLLIIDHPGTSLNIAMASNIPTVLFWDVSHFPLNDDGNKFIEEFKANNMFFEDLKALVSFIENNSMNFEKWWSNSKIQKLRKNWCNQYAHSNDNWKNEWYKFIKRI